MKETVSSLIRQLGHKDFTQRMLATTKLSQMDEKAIPALIRTASLGGDKNWPIRWCACVALSWIGFEKVFPYLKKIVGKHKDWRTRTVAVELLGIFRRHEGLSYVKSALKDKHPITRADAAYVLQRLSSRSRGTGQK